MWRISRRSRMCQWSAAATTRSLAVIPIPPEVRDAVRRLRLGLRDVRDGMARRKRWWREVCCSGMTGSDRTALVMITHEGIDH
jgi:hypothetical protein